MGDRQIMAAAESNIPDFESALAELEELVEKMEQGELSLEESLACFERGVGLTRTCQTALSEAQLKVDQLLAKQAVKDDSSDEESE